MFISFINNAWGDTHNLNRIQGLKDLDVQHRIFAYRRSFYPPKENVDFIDLGSLDQRGAVQRLGIYLNAFRTLWRSKKIDSEVLYVFGFDNLFIVQLIRLFKWKKNKVIFEIPDIKNFQLMSGVKGKIFSKIEKWLLYKTDHIVFTSSAYVDSYFEQVKKLSLSNFTIIENKIHTVYNTNRTALELRKCNTNVKQNKEVIGYFGLLRCERSLLFLDELTQKYPQYYVILRGVFLDNTTSLKERLSKNKNISYLGKYVSPIHLKDMYQEIDLSWIAYPYSNKVPGNWQWARTNRFYEAGYYKIPMIAGKGTEDGKEVLKRFIGIEVDLNNITKAVEDFHENYMLQKENWKKNIESIDEQEFVMTDEYVNLLETINSLSN